jgi:myo-inositol-1(or 4)-monophosphatase
MDNNTKTHSLPDYLAAAMDAARTGAAILESWRSKFKVIEKARADLVTEADVASQKGVREYLLGLFPDHGFVGEEDFVGQPIEATRPPSDDVPTWVVDPLDGTTNFVHDVPAYCVSIGLWWHGEAVVGVIYDPRMKEMFTAAKGCGAYLNGEPMKVSAAPNLHDALLSTGFPAKYEAQMRNFEAWKRLSSQAQALRRSGSTALNLAYVACGRFDGYWAYDNWPWDVMAGAALVSEAGGKLSGIEGGPFDPFRPDCCITNGSVHGELLQVVNDGR